MESNVQKLDYASDFDWQDFEIKLADFARLAKSDAPFEQVAKALIDSLIEALAPVGVALWLPDAEGQLRLDCDFNLGVLGEHAHSDAHLRLLDTLRCSGQSEVMGPHQPETRAITAGYLIIVVPLSIENSHRGLIEVIQRPTIRPEAIDGNLRFAALLAELAADQLRRSRIQELRQQFRRQEQLEALLSAVHGSLDPRVIASELANEGRRMTECDRVSVAVRRGKRFRLAAVSSIDSINRRAVLVKRLERLVELLSATGEEFWYSGDKQALPPQLETTLFKYLDESHARTLGILPLFNRVQRGNRSSKVVIGALVLEGFDSRVWDPGKVLSRVLAKHGALALRNAYRYRTLPTFPFLRTRQEAFGEPAFLVGKTVGAICLIAMAASTFFIPAEFYLYANGELQPAHKRHIFAPLDGEVSTVLVAHGDTVRDAQSLIEMTSPELDLEIQRIQGEHDATLQRSLALESTLLDYSSSLDPESHQINQLSAEQAELRQLFLGQKERLDALRQQREKLVIRSPISGVVLTWETKEQLLNRPLVRGQRLMTIADLQGPWQAELKVPDGRVGPLLELMDNSNPHPATTFELATDLGSEFHGEIARVARRTEIDQNNQPVVRVTVNVDETTFVDLRPGATVYAKINCGQRSLFYVWCHRIVDRVLGWFRF